MTPTPTPSDLMERDEATGDPIYLHAADCPSFCDYACNGQDGSRAAAALAKREGRKLYPGEDP